MAGFSVDEDEEISAINVTPLVDVMLVLLIIFMVTTSVIAQTEGIGIDKPEAATGQQIDPGTSIMLLCHKDGTLEMDGTRMPDNDTIRAAVRARVAENADVQGIVQCDREVDVATMVDLVDILRDSGVKKYAIATQKPAAEG